MVSYNALIIHDSNNYWAHGQGWLTTNSSFTRANFCHLLSCGSLWLEIDIVLPFWMPSFRGKQHIQTNTCWQKTRKGIQVLGRKIETNRNIGSKQRFKTQAGAFYDSNHWLTRLDGVVSIKDVGIGLQCQKTNTADSPNDNEYIMYLIYIFSM
jgi:hypothetical protein